MRALRLKATPHAIAAGVAAGVFVAFLPIPGLHLIVAAVAAWLIAGNVVAAALGSALGNPLTFPLIWGATYEIGAVVLRRSEPETILPTQLGHSLRHLGFAELWEMLLKPMTVGAVPLGLIFAVVFYILTRWGIAAFHERRLQRLAEKTGNDDSAQGTAVMDQSP